MTKRVEIIINQSVEEDLRDALNELAPPPFFTRFSPVYGKGNSGPREGSPTWPESSNCYLLFLGEEQIEPLKEAVQSIKERFPSEGIKCFISAGAEEVL